ncbi:MAG: hypothetical protein H7293_20010 [Candidatus Saccharibacteria bacterium]|nr:hypothetical protein [Rhodoferax sp.]
MSTKWLDPYRWLLAIGLLGVLWLGYGAWAEHQQGIGEQRATTRYNKAIEKQKGEARVLLASETAKKEAAEKALRDFKDQQELKDATNKKTVDSLSTQLRAAAGPTGRLRDPNTAGCGRGSGATQGPNTAIAGSGPDNPTETSGLFSKEATGLLQQLTSEADDINIAYIACRADGEAVRRLVPQ